LAATQVVGAVEQTSLVGDGGTETDMEAKKPGKSEKVNTGRKLYTGFSALNYHQDYMEVLYKP
jgi:hypothetical protein